MDIVSQELLQSIMSQYSAEVGEAELDSKQLMMLRMKYGLSAPQLIPSEKYLIQKFDQ